MVNIIWFHHACRWNGVEGGSFEGSEKLFYTPQHEVYNLYKCDKNCNGESICGFFWEDI
jgi:hypothetical protein